MEKSIPVLSSFVLSARKFFGVPPDRLDENTEKNEDEYLVSKSILIYANRFKIS